MGWKGPWWMHLVSQVWVGGESVEMQMMYQHLWRIGGRAMGMHIFFDSGGIQNSPGAWGYFLA